MQLCRHRDWTRPGSSTLVARFAPALTALFVAVPTLLANRAGADSLHWVREASARSIGVVRAVAVAPTAGSRAFADEVGVWIRANDASPRRVLRAEGVEDLVYDEDGGLWVGGADGLWWIAPSELGLAGTGTGAQDRSTAPGAASRHVHRLSRSGRWLAAATEAGVFVSVAGTHWFRIDGAAPAGASASVAVACESETRCEVWWIAGSSLWHAELALARDPQIEIEHVREVAIAGAPAAVAPLDIAVGFPGLRVAVVYPQSLAVLDAPNDDLNDWRFHVWRPVLPPGAEARRLAYGLDRYWLATDRGLMTAGDLRDAWRRAGVPAGWLAASSVASDATRLFVATATGVVRADRVGVPVLAEAAAPTSPVRGMLGREAEPVRDQAKSFPDQEESRDSLARLHRLALAHLSLDPARQRNWRRRADSRSWWPEVGLALSYGGSLDRGIDEDQSFVSSAERQLNDRNRDRGDDWDASLSFKWDLPEAIFDGEVLAVAREERLWISLRDDVLDEINQLYFERRRVLLELAATPDAASIEAARLRLRADELAAGLEAWTGGAFRSSDAAFDPSRDRGDALDWQPSRAHESPVGSRTE